MRIDRSSSVRRCGGQELKGRTCLAAFRRRPGASGPSAKVCRDGIGVESVTRFHARRCAPRSRRGILSACKRLRRRPANPSGTASSSRIESPDGPKAQSRHGTIDTIYRNRRNDSLDAPEPPAYCWPCSKRSSTLRGIKHASHQVLHSVRRGESSSAHRRACIRCSRR
jgi:hypothetical protein